MSFLPRRLSSDKIYPGIQFAELKRTGLLSTILPIWQFNYFYKIPRERCAVPLESKSASLDPEGYAVSRDAGPDYEVPRESCAVPLESTSATLDLEGYTNGDESFIDSLQKSGHKSNIDNLQKSGQKSNLENLQKSGHKSNFENLQKNGQLSFLENLQISGQKSNLEYVQKSGQKSNPDSFDDFGWLIEKL